MTKTHFASARLRCSSSRGLSSKASLSAHWWQGGHGGVCNVRVTIHGREVQWTLRDTDEARLAVRLEELLQRYPLPQPAPAPTSQGPSQGQGKGWCAKHQTQMKLNHGQDGRSWYSHRTDEGRWCKGR